MRQGETLASIAEKYKTSVAAIRSANHLSKKSLSVGQRLNVPIRGTKASGSAGKATESGRAMNHRVQKGDTLSALSLKYGIPVTEIRKINGLKNDTLKIGQRLQLATRNEEAPGKGAEKSGDPGEKGESQVGDKTGPGKGF